MTEQPLLITVSGSVATLTFNRPDSLNALNSALRRTLVDALAELDARDDVAVIVLTGRGRAFCAGLDVKELGGSDRNVTENIEGRDIGAVLAGLSKPIIASVNGLAVTGGFEITLACDMVLAAESAWFQDTHVKIGLLPGWGLSQRLSRVVGPYRAKEISLSGRRVTAAEAGRLGFVNRVIPDADLASEAADLAGSVAQWPPERTQTIKSLVDRGYHLPFAEALDLEAREARRHNAQVTLRVDRAKDMH